MKYWIHALPITLGRLATTRITITESNVDSPRVSGYPVSPGVATRTDRGVKNLDLCVRCRL